MRHVIGMAAIALALGACSGERGEEKRASADANASGFVPPSVTSRLDYGGAMDRRFRGLDRDADDFISRAELPRRNPRRLLALDRNGDGKISAIEFSEGMLARFDRMDLNHDGTVTSEERRSAGAQ
jgi:hypothetical protein